MELSPRRWFSRGLAGAATTALVHTPAVTVAAVVDTVSGPRPRLLHLASAARHSPADAVHQARQLLGSLPYRETRVCALMPSGNYQLLLLDAASVPEAELREAMRWQLKDLVSVPPERLAIDVFHSPPRPNANTARQVYVVAAEQVLVDQQAAVVTEATRRLDAIDIPELALRNIMSLVPGEGSGCALLMLGHGFVQILISRQGSLYVMRRLDGTVAHDPEQIGLEVQRSLQYYETHFDCAPIAQLLIAPANAQATALAPQLSAATGLGVSVLRLESLFDSDGPFPDIDRPESLLALGAALRPLARKALQ